MNILVIGSGGREHALVWKIAQSDLVKKIYCAPGNAGIAALAENISIDVNDFEALVEFAQSHEIDLTVVGPEDPLVNGIVDRFIEAGLRIFGPRKTAAQLEGSKSFAKKLMKEYHIPTARFDVFSQKEKAVEYLRINDTYPVVLKASGLAAGKGVLICRDEKEALNGLEDMMDKKLFGKAGDQVVIEEFLTGEEVSIFVLSDGKTYRLLTSSQDHKRIYNADQGKNTGGMGAYAPAPVATPELLKETEEKIIKPSLDAIREKGCAYTGILYIGLILTDSGARVLEYNCRFGDPETEVVLPLLKSDLVPLLNACTDGTLSDHQIEVQRCYAVDVVLASGGYPDKYEKHKKISGLDKLPEDITVFHAGTAIVNNTLVTNGGRVLNIIATGPDFMTTQRYLYASIEKIHFENMHYRTDIGFRALQHLKE
jgi:phosphoribosylamine--glycine ligase